MAEGEEKTQPATPKKREESREKGSSAKSQDLSGAAVLITALAAVALTSGSIMTRTQQMMIKLFSDFQPREVTMNSLFGIGGEGLSYMAAVLLPIFGAAFVMALLSSAAQESLVIAKKALQPKFSKLNPISGFKNIFSSKALVEFAKGILKLSILGGISVWILTSAAVEVAAMVGAPPESILTTLGAIAAKLVFACAAVLLALAIPDYVYTKWKFEKDIRMSIKEVQDEYKEQEGDPHVKAQIRSLMREAAMKRMMQDVKTADVVLTNPTHFAVAIRYESTKGAPEVVAKGARLVAQRIKDEAKKHGVPIVENPPLARTLYRTVEIGSMIPRELYQAVAEILAFVYSLPGRRRRA